MSQQTMQDVGTSDLTVHPRMSHQAARRASETICKRALAACAALLLIALLSPLIVTVALAIKATGSPILYAHRRVGRNGRPFSCYKFRSMRPDADRLLVEHLAKHPEAACEWQATRKLRNDPRITSLGRMLRTSSVDELPQLFNILCGDMNFVGPRPIVFDELHHYGSAARDYFSVRPGLTGLWQVSGRSLMDYADRVKLDRQYVRDQSSMKDLAIIVRTVPAVMRRRQAF